MIAEVRLYIPFSNLNEHIRTRIKHPECYGTFFPVKVEVKSDMTIEMLLVADALQSKEDLSIPGQRIQLHLEKL